MHALEMTTFRALAYIAYTKSLEFTAFRALAYTKFLDFTRNLGKLRVMSRISFDLQSALSLCANMRHKLRMQTAKSHDPFHKRSQNRHFRGRPTCTRGLGKKPANLYILYSRAEKIRLQALNYIYIYTYWYIKYNRKFWAFADIVCMSNFSAR